MNLHSGDSAAFDPSIDPLLKDVPSRCPGPVDLAWLFSDESIDRLLRDVPGRMTSISPLAADRHRRGVVDLEAMASSLRVGAPLVEPAGRRDAFGAGLSQSRVQIRRLTRSAARLVREAISVAVVLSLVVGLFSASVMTSTWLSQPLLNASRTAIASSRGDRSAGSTRANAIASGGGGSGGVRADQSSQPSPSPPASRGSSPQMLVARSEEDTRGGRSGREPSTRFAEVGAAEVDRAGSDAARGGQIAADDPAGRGAPGAGGTRRDVGVDAAGDSRLEGRPLELRAAPLPSSRGPVAGGMRSGAFDPNEPLRVVAGRPAVSRIIPSHRGYDLAFEITRGEPPFVDPSLTAILAVDQPPLSRRTDTFDAAARLLAAAQNPPGHPTPQSSPQSSAVQVAGPSAVARRERLREAVAALRAEDVLAALPAPATAIESVKPFGDGPVIRLSGAASLSGLPSSRLVEISVTALPLPAARRPVREIVYVLDGSACAGAEEAWPAICRGLDEAVGLLGPASSITVVVFADRPVVVAREVRPSGFSVVRERLAGFRVRGSGDLHGCMETVRGWKGERCVIVAHAGSIARAERDGDPDLAAWRRLQAGEGEFSDAADVRSNPLAGDRAIEVVQIDAASGATGESVGRRGRSPVDGVGLDSAAIRRSIVEASLGGRPEGTLGACRLEVAFDPAQVAAYRLVGHRRQVLDLADTRSAVVDLPPGACVRVVYEVVLRNFDPRGDRGAANAADVVRATVGYRAGGHAPGGELPESLAVAGISASRLAVDPPAADAVGELVWLAVAVAEQAAGSAHVDSIQRLRERIRDRFDRSVDVGEPIRGQLHALWSAL